MGETRLRRWEPPSWYFVHRHLECQVGGAADNGQGFCENKVCVNGGGSENTLVMSVSTGQGRMWPVWRLPACQAPQEVAFAEEQVGSETQPHHVSLGAGPASF